MKILSEGLENELSEAIQPHLDGASTTPIIRVIDETIVNYIMRTASNFGTQIGTSFANRVISFFSKQE